MDSINIFEAVADFEAVVERVVADRTPVEITQEHCEGVVLIPTQEWATIVRTMNS
jgi:prevent-host-death family protein